MKDAAVRGSRKSAVYCDVGGVGDQQSTVMLGGSLTRPSVMQD